MTFNIYVPSYNRFDRIMTQKFFEYCTYVVRKSQEESYRNAGVKSIWAVEDSLIDSLEKVENYILDNAPEDVIAIVDDDVKSISYRLESLTKIDSPTEVTQEVERFAQIMFDLNVGYLACPSDANVKFYDRPFKFVGITGGFKMFNRGALKTRLKEGLKFLSDIQFELEELLKNRIILIPNYFCVQCHVDTNAGGNNTEKSLAEFAAENEIMKMRWGKYYVKADGGSAGRIRVDR